MQLAPVNKADCEPTYPRRKWVRSTWLKRALGVAAVSVAMGLGACGGGGDRLTDDWEDVDMPGAMPAPNFWCADEQPDSLPTLSSPGTYDGELCGESTGWAAIEVGTDGVYQLELLSGVEHVGLAVINPDGEQVAQLDDELSVVNIAFTSGQWTFAATANDPVSNGWAWFQLSIQPLDD